MPRESLRLSRIVPRSLTTLLYRQTQLCPRWHYSLALQVCNICITVPGQTKIFILCRSIHRGPAGVHPRNGGVADEAVLHSFPAAPPGAVIDTKTVNQTVPTLYPLPPYPQTARQIMMDHSTFASLHPPVLRPIASMFLISCSTLRVFPTCSRLIPNATSVPA